ncbi:MAG: hypothetical protein U0547_01775 [Dehalococcoidia bacterium]
MPARDRAEEGGDVACDLFGRRAGRGIDLAAGEDAPVFVHQRCAHVGSADVRGDDRSFHVPR